MRLIPANRNRSRWCIATFGPSGCPLRTDFSSATCLCREADSIQQWKIIQKKIAAAGATCKQPDAGNSRLNRRRHSKRRPKVGVYSVPAIKHLAWAACQVNRPPVIHDLVKSPLRVATFGPGPTQQSSKCGQMARGLSPQCPNCCHFPLAFTDRWPSLATHCKLATAAATTRCKTSH